MKSYVDITYRNIRFSNYPLELAKYLYHRYQFTEGAEIADIGCGRGEYTKAFLDLGLKPVGYDCEIPNLDDYENLIDRFVDIDLDDRDMHIGRFFEIVFLKSVIEHVEDPVYLLDNMHDILYTDPPGRIIVITPDFKSAGLSFWGDFDHKHPFTKQSLSDILEYTGFEDIEVERFYQVPLLWRRPWLKPFIIGGSRLIPLSLRKRWPPALHASGPVLLASAVVRHH